MPTSYYFRDEPGNSCKDDTFLTGCIKRGTVLKLHYEVEIPGSVLRYNGKNH